MINQQATLFGVKPYQDMPGRRIISSTPYSYRSATHFGCWMPGLPLFKYVDEKDAHFLERGSVKIGTLRGYAALEGPRQDAGENHAHLSLSKGNIDDPQYRAAVERSGIIKFAPGSKNIEFALGLQVIIPGPNAYCFCLSHRGDLVDDPGRPQALFRIDDVNEWCRRVQEMNPKVGQLERFQVMYRSRTRDGRTPGDENPHALVKPPKYRDEYEVRIIGGVGGERRGVPDDAPIIYGADDRQLAELMKRVR